MIKDDIEKIVSENKIRRIFDFQNGKVGNETQNSDFYSVYNELLLHYSENEITEGILELFCVTEFKVEEFSNYQKCIVILLISSLYQIHPNDRELVNNILIILIKSINKNPEFHKKEFNSRKEYEQKYLIDLAEFSASTSVKSLNNIQKCALITKHYVDICEGIYSNSLSILVLYIDALTGKNRSLESINLLNVTDKLNIIKSYSSELKKIIEIGYNNIIRNASAHKSYDIKNWPNIIFTNTDRYGNKTILECDEIDISQKMDSLYSISNSLFAAFTLIQIHPSYDKILEEGSLKFLEGYKNNDLSEMLELCRNPQIKST